MCRERAALPEERSRVPRRDVWEIRRDVKSLATIQTGLFPENEASVRLVGFRIVGVRERPGRHGGVWRDVLFLERRSPVVD